MQTRKILLRKRFGISSAATLAATAGLALGSALGLAGCFGAPTTTEGPTERDDQPNVNAGLAALGGAGGPARTGSSDPTPADPLLADGVIEAPGAGESDPEGWAHSAAMLEQYFNNLRDPWAEEDATSAATLELTDEPAAVTRPRVAIESPPATEIGNPEAIEGEPGSVVLPGPFVREPAPQPEHTSEPEAAASAGPAIASADGSIPAGSLPGGEGLVSADAEPTAPARMRAPEERKVDLIEDLTIVLRELATTRDDGFREALALAGLESLSPNALGDLAQSGVLLPEETRGLLAARELLATLAETGGTDMDRLADAIDGIADEVRQDTNLKITAAALCTRVEGYGRYDPFPTTADGTYRFLAGRRQPVILYVEVDRFARGAVDLGDGSARWEVVLSQGLEIFAAGDGTLVMRRQAETDRSVSRAKIRDYYLINQTYLPETLSVGRYNLKVTMRDEQRGALAETIVPFEIVAERQVLP